MGGFFANAEAGHLEREKAGGSSIDIDPMDMSEGMQEAMHRSNLDMRYKLDIFVLLVKRDFLYEILMFVLLAYSGAEYIRKEVPLHVLPTTSLLRLDSPLTSFTDLQRVLFEEERAAYNQALSQNMRCSLNAEVNITILIF